jgi:hypothetical protein
VWLSPGKEAGKRGSEMSVLRSFAPELLDSLIDVALGSAVRSFAPELLNSLMGVALGSCMRGTLALRFAELAVAERGGTEWERFTEDPLGLPGFFLMGYSCAGSRRREDPVSRT